MSTPNPTHIGVIARGLALASDDACFDREPDDDSPSDAEDRDYWMKLARASVSKLTDAGYSIVETADLEDEKLTREAALECARKWSDAAQGARKSEMHWPADCLMEAAAFVIGASAAAGEKP